jgi:hypothetical protein
VRAIYERISIENKRSYKTIGILCPGCHQIALLENVAIIDPIRYRNEKAKEYQYNWPKKRKN